MNRLTLLHFLVFMSDFVASWFKSYSIYLAGERKEQATNAFENVFTALWENQYGRIIAGLLAESFFLYEFIDFNFEVFIQLAAMVNWKNADEHGNTQLTDLKDIQDLLQWNGYQLCASYLYKVLFSGIVYRVLVAIV